MDKVYYQEMLKKERLIPFFKNDRMVCFITFYICDDKSKYIQSDPWEVLDDNPNGEICYISQLITDKTSHKENHKLAYEVWHRFQKYIKINFPSVKKICWRRWDRKTETVKTYKKELN